MSFYVLSISLSNAVELQRARDELEHTETPWEPYRELAPAIAEARTTARELYIFVPWRLVPALITTLTRAKDTCNPSRAVTFVRLRDRAARALEARPAIDRLGDLA